MPKSDLDLNRSQRRQLERARRRVERRLARGERIEELDGGRIGINMRHGIRVLRNGTVIAQYGDCGEDINEH